MTASLKVQRLPYQLVLTSFCTECCHIKQQDGLRRTFLTLSEHFHRVLRYQTTRWSHILSVALQEEFLATLRDLQPDLCLTAAYGNYLPTKFLSIPKYGTVNIHPSLLPKYRGAAPVQRALQVRSLSLLCVQA